MHLILIQTAVAILSPLGLWLLANSRIRYAVFVSLVGQVGYIALFVYSAQWIMLIPTAVYTAIWVDTWKKARADAE